MTSPRWKHGAHGYKAHGCRCPVCKSAMSAYGKARYVPAVKVEPVNTLTSWWTTVSRDGLTKHVEVTHQGRMSVSTIGHGRGRAISTTEIEPR